MLSERACVVADAGIAVLGEQGSRALTHRAVDLQAGLSPGSTSNVARTRSALLALILDRLVEHELAAYGGVTGETVTDAGGLAEMLADAVHATSTRGRVNIVARYELSLEAGRRPELRTRMTAAVAMIMVSARQVMVAAGSREPDRHARQMTAFMEGLVFTTAVDARPPLSRQELAVAFHEFLAGMVS